LRTQADYRDELQLQKFAAGKDRHWKPFVAHLFGFNETPVERKYELDEEVERLKQKQAEQQTMVQYSEDQLPELTAKISALHQQVNEVEESLDAFRFDDEERRILRDLVNEIETEDFQPFGWYQLPQTNLCAI
jgi:septal ring factor EnvC (AmiA/AmiB activator)